MFAYLPNFALSSRTSVTWQGARVRQPKKGSCCVVASTWDSGLTRRALLTWFTLLAAGAVAPRSASSGAGSALTRKLYPKPGFNVEEDVERPPIKDEDIARVQKQLTTLRDYRKAVGDISAKFEAAPGTADVTGDLERVFRFDTLRNTLNVVADANFDEEVQKRTDRLVRNILQDLNELEVAARIRGNQGVRTPRKIDAVRKWLHSMATDMDRLLAYYPDSAGITSASK
ncbi:hypothetical protein CCYA_CCYA02G0769 [Cyanidiococcus yangmingshanensis]|nr:hypothetical protein CCYA_CCYA02G0769 [Cyanidiococcus yangmingshanensis]